MEIQELIKELIQKKITMVNFREFQTILDHYDNILKIPGDIVECGCWRGGFSIFLSTLFANKKIWVCDSFAGFQPLDHATYEYAGERHIPSMTHNMIGPMSISLEEVQNYFIEYNLLDKNKQNDRIQFIKGFVKDSLPTSGIENISLLRIDVDAFSATLEVLELLYDKVSVGGFIVFDDSALRESLDAIKAFIKQRNLETYLIHPSTHQKLDLFTKHSNDNSGFPAGCYLIKQ